MYQDKLTPAFVELFGEDSARAANWCRRARVSAEYVIGEVWLRLHSTHAGQNPLHVLRSVIRDEGLAGRSVASGRATSVDVARVNRRNAKTDSCRQVVAGRPVVLDEVRGRAADPAELAENRLDYPAVVARIDPRIVPVLRGESTQSESDIDPSWCRVLTARARERFATI